MPENTRRSGCGCGGCLLFCFYTLILILGGMFLSDLKDANWNPNTAKDKLIKDSSDIVFLIKDVATEIITGEESSSSGDTPESINNLIKSGDESYANAMALLKKAREVSGEERQKILRSLQSELQKSLNHYQQAAEKNKNDPELQKKISHLQDLLDKMTP